MDFTYYVQIHKDKAVPVEKLRLLKNSIPERIDAIMSSSRSKNPHNAVKRIKIMIFALVWNEYQQNDRELLIFSGNIFKFREWYDKHQLSRIHEKMRELAQDPNAKDLKMR